MLSQMLCFLFLLMHVSPGENAGIAFLAKDWALPNIPFVYKFKRVHYGEKFEIDCTTNDTLAKVSLAEQKESSPFENSLTKKKGRIIQIGQKFIVSPVDYIDTGKYQCTARNNVTEKTLFLGTLTVSQINVKDRPEVFHGNGTLFIEKGREYKISCKTIGVRGTSYKIIEWYKQISPGKRKKLDGEHIDEGDKPVDVVTYTFKNFTKDDAGKYICVKNITSNGKNYVQETELEVDLEAPMAPKLSFPDFTSEQTILTVNKSNTINILCSVVASPKPKWSWKKGGVVVKYCEDYEDNCLLSIPNSIHPKNSGVYECVGTNSEGTAEKNITVVVQVVPVLVKSTNTYAATFEEEKTLECIATEGNPAPQFLWESQVDTCNPDDKNCIPLENSWTPVKKQSPDKEVGTMSSRITSKPSKVNYFYRCTASNAAGRDVFTFQLIRTLKKKSLFEFTASLNPINDESPLKLVCSYDNIMFQSAVIRKSGSTDSLSTKEKLENKTKTIWYDKPVAELTDAGNYTCEATYKRGGSEKKTVTVIVKALVAPSIVDFDNRTVIQNQKKNIKLQCNVSGNPQPTVSWQHNNKPISTNNIIDLERCATMKSGIYRDTNNAQFIYICGLNFQKHSGLYTCEAGNIVEKISKNLYLTVEAYPIIQNWMNKTNVGINHPLIMLCQAPANPPANITWFKVDKNKMTEISVGAYLRLDEVNEKNVGVYQCDAVNVHGKDSKRVQVILAGSVVNNNETSSSSVIIGIVIGFCILIIIIIIAALWYRRHLKQKYALYLEPKKNFTIDKDRSLFDQSSELPYSMSWEFPRERLTFIKTLGSGAFGQVWLAEAEGIHGFKPRDSSIDARKRRKSIQKTSQRYHRMSFRYKKSTQLVEASLEKSIVAVKTLKEDAAEGEYKDLASELKILIHLGEHKNLVNLLGACTTGGKLCVILECCPHGSLLSFLRTRRETFTPVWKKYQTDMENEFTYIDFLMIAWQVGKGMDFLQSKKCVHRDLAARNVLVGHDYVMKIADFGLARDIYKDEFYLKESTGLLPVKWMAPESLFDKVYTSSSDVWSFGILLWEIFTLGGSPYPSLPTEDLFNFLEDGRRMDCPDLCPKDVYEIMYDCWKKSPYERPLFAQIVERLNNVMKQNVSEGESRDYLDFQEPQDNYLMPAEESKPLIEQNNLKTPEESNGKLKRGASSEYLEATSANLFHNKGDYHIPLLSEKPDDDDDEDDDDVRYVKQYNVPYNPDV